MSSRKSRSKAAAVEAPALVEPALEPENRVFLIAFKGGRNGRGRFLSNQPTACGERLYVTPWKIQALYFPSRELAEEWLGRLEPGHGERLSVVPLDHPHKPERLPLAAWVNDISIGFKIGQRPDLDAFPESFPGDGNPFRTLPFSYSGRS